MEKLGYADLMGAELEDVNPFESADLAFTQHHKPFDLLDFIMAYEGGDDMDEDKMVEGFQHLINTGEVWALQGHYGRTAAALISSGHCTDPRVNK